MSERLLDLKLRTKAFALRVIRMDSELPKNDTVAQVLGKKVLRLRTSVGANYREAITAAIDELTRDRSAFLAAENELN